MQSMHCDGSDVHIEVVWTLPEYVCRQYCEAALHIAPLQSKVPHAAPWVRFPLLSQVSVVPPTHDDLPHAMSAALPLTET